MKNSEDSTSPVPPALALTNLKKTFGRVTAVDSVSCQIQQGEIVALLGSNGAGKTTLIDMALGLQTPDEGEAAILGMRPREALKRSLVGVVNQTGSLMGDYTVEGSLKLFSAMHVSPLAVEKVLDITHLRELRRSKVGKLSGGEQQRLRLALALLPDPLVLILDEPTAGMDATARQDFWAVMAEEASRGRTILFATHYLAEAEDFAARTIIMKAGNIVADAPTGQLRGRGTGHLSMGIPAGSRTALEEALAGADPRAEWEYRWSETAVEIVGADLDAAARVLLNYPGTSGLKISDSSLEEVFTEMMRQTA